MRLNSTYCNPVFLSDDECSTIIPPLSRLAGVVVCDDWLSQCIQFLTCTGAVNTSLSLGVVFEQVYKTYLDSDIYTNFDEMNLLPVNLEVGQCTTASHMMC